MADKRIKISSIQIKNFRSIRNESIKPTDFNILVGTNDVGKSNILKALNLFFNGQTDYNTPFDFHNDFTYLFPPKSNSTKEIKITVKFEIPDTYTECGIYTWTKIWRTNNYFDEEILNNKNEKPNAKSRVPGALKRIKFRYVPAVKSSLYYKTLLGDLYSAVAASIGSPLLSSATDFSVALKDYTKSISEEVNARLKMLTELTIPNNLNDIFQALIFETCETESGIRVPLTSRGDGIQARHIPIILHYIAMEDQKSRNKGSMKVCTIWGFEEPENGLELNRTFQMANEFQEYSNEIQIFTTTHSPAFYMQKENSHTKVFFVYKKADSEITEIKTEKSELIAKNMGLMPIVAPFIAEQEKKLEQAQLIYSQNILTDIPTIMVEGETDIKLLETAILVHSEFLNNKLKNNEMRIVCKNDGAGSTQLVDWVFAWIYSGFRSKLYVLLDKDEAGIKARGDIVNSEIFKTKQNHLSIRVKHIEPSIEIISLLKKNIKIEFEIEHLLSCSFWKKLKKHNYVSARTDEDLARFFDGLIPRNKTLDSVIVDLINDEVIRDTILTFEPKELKKNKICELLKKSESVHENTIGLKKTLKNLEEYFA